MWRYRAYFSDGGELMGWIVHVRKLDDIRCDVWLSEVELMESGVLVSTGRKTPSFTTSLSGDFKSVEISLRQSLDVMSEPMLSSSRHSLTVSCIIGKLLEDQLLGDGGDDLVEQV